VHFVEKEKVEDQKKKKKEKQNEWNITMKYIIIIPIYSFTDKLHCLINTATALLESLTD